MSIVAKFTDYGKNGTQKDSTLILYRMAEPLQQWTYHIIGERCSGPDKSEPLRFNVSWSDSAFDMKKIVEFIKLALDIDHNRVEVSVHAINLINCGQELPELSNDNEIFGYDADIILAEYVWRYVSMIVH